MQVNMNYTPPPQKKKKSMETMIMHVIQNV